MKNDFCKQSDVQMRTHLSIVLLKSLIFHFRFHVHALCFFLQAREQTEKANFFNLEKFYCLIFFCCGICLSLTSDLIEPRAVRGVDVKSSWLVIGAKPVSKGKKICRWLIEGCFFGEVHWQVDLSRDQLKSINRPSCFFLQHNKRPRNNFFV